MRGLRISLNNLLRLYHGCAPLGNDLPGNDPSRDGKILLTSETKTLRRYIRGENVFNSMRLRSYSADMRLLASKERRAMKDSAT